MWKVAIKYKRLIFFHFASVVEIYDSSHLSLSTSLLDFFSSLFIHASLFRRGHFLHPHSDFLFSLFALKSVRIETSLSLSLEIRSLTASRTRARTVKGLPLSLTFSDAHFKLVSLYRNALSQLQKILSSLSCSPMRVRLRCLSLSSISFPFKYTSTYWRCT